MLLYDHVILDFKPLKKCEGMEKVFNANGSKKNAGTAIFISDNIDFKTHCKQETKTLYNK